MKRFTKIYIALLAACVLGGSALALTGCSGADTLMEDTGDMVSDMVSDVASGFNDMVSAVLPDTASSMPSDNSANMTESMDPFTPETSSISGNYREGYLAGYSSAPFVETFEQNLRNSLGSDGMAENVTVEWQEGWKGSGEYAPDEKSTTLMRDGEMPFTGCVIYDDQNGGENVYYLYMTYNPSDNTVSAVRVYDGRDGRDMVMDQEEASRAIEEMMMK